MFSLPTREPPRISTVCSHDRTREKGNPFKVAHVLNFHRQDSGNDPAIRICPTAIFCRPTATGSAAGTRWAGKVQRTALQSLLVKSQVQILQLPACPAVPTSEVAWLPSWSLPGPILYPVSRVEAARCPPAEPRWVWAQWLSYGEFPRPVARALRFFFAARGGCLRRVVAVEVRGLARRPQGLHPPSLTRPSKSSLSAKSSNHWILRTG